MLLMLMVLLLLGTLEAWFVSVGGEKGREKKGGGRQRRSKGREERENRYRQRKKARELANIHMHINKLRHYLSPTCAHTLANTAHIHIACSRILSILTHTHTML